VSPLWVLVSLALSILALKTTCITCQDQTRLKLIEAQRSTSENDYLLRYYGCLRETSAQRSTFNLWLVPPPNGPRVSRTWASQMHTTSLYPLNPSIRLSREPSYRAHPKVVIHHRNTSAMYVENCPNRCKYMH
jgi:hypothetical protein